MYIKFNCRCAVRNKCDKLQVQTCGIKSIMFDIKHGKSFYGVILNKNDTKKLIKFLTISITKEDK